MAIDACRKNNTEIIQKNEDDPKEGGNIEILKKTFEE